MVKKISNILYKYDNLLYVFDIGSVLLMKAQTLVNKNLNTLNTSEKILARMGHVSYGHCYAVRQGCITLDLLELNLHVHPFPRGSMLGLLPVIDHL